jgi:hypothetical protein
VPGKVEIVEEKRGRGDVRWMLSNVLQQERRRTTLSRTNGIVQDKQYERKLLPPKIAQKRTKEAIIFLQYS